MRAGAAAATARQRRVLREVHLHEQGPCSVAGCACATAQPNRYRIIADGHPRALAQKLQVAWSMGGDHPCEPQGVVRGGAAIMHAKQERESEETVADGQCCGT